MTPPWVTRQSAVRAWVEPHSERPERKEAKKGPGWRKTPYGDRVLVFDTETTTDTAQRLLFGFFRLYIHDGLAEEALIVSDVLDQSEMECVTEYAARCGLKMYSREQFVEQIFYPEVYLRGAVCVGFNLPFDLSRIAYLARCGSGRNRRKFTFALSRRLTWHDLRIESTTGSAAFIGFTPKRKLYDWEQPFFNGRFCDLSAVARAFNGKRNTLKSAGKAYRAYTRKMEAPELGSVTRASLTYGRQDVRATWALYKALRTEYIHHPFATFANERKKPKHSRYMGRLSSTASVAKEYLRQLGIAPLLEKQPRFSREYLGWFLSAYFGGRADVRVRKLDVPVWLLDFVSMYPTIFCLQRLDRVLTAPEIDLEDATDDVTALVTQMASGSRYVSLFDPKLWLKLNCLVQLDPHGAILPIRMRAEDNEPYTIAVSPIQTKEPRWYTLADVLAGMLLGGSAPTILKAVRVVPKGRRKSKVALFRGLIPLHSNLPFFKTIVEERQKAKSESEADKTLKPLELGLKIFANSGAYGIFAEINVQPTKTGKTDAPGNVFSDTNYPSLNIHDERPGAYFNPIIATLVTGGARLMLALLESEVAKRGGSFTFCDTDSLAINGGPDCPKGIPSISESDVDEIIEQFNALNPYHRSIVPNLLKKEHTEHPNLRCFAISAKRYVLFKWLPNRRIEIVKASESALGAIIGRTPTERTEAFARNVWLKILMDNLNVSDAQRRESEASINFDLPMRRKFPINQPAIYKRMAAFNKDRSYDQSVKPFGFVQTVTPETQVGRKDVLPIAPREDDAQASMKLQWIDFRTGKRVKLDWFGTGHAGTVSVMRLDEYIKKYQEHPEAKAADQHGNVAGGLTIGLLSRLAIQSEPVWHIGKEVDRLDEDRGSSIVSILPVEYERDDLDECIVSLSRFPQAEVAAEIAISERAWRSIVKSASQPRDATARKIRASARRRQVALSATDGFPAVRAPRSA
ncbi:MAG TPA: hypothetical protein VGF98_09085 [Candidatus Tumulicola sp.]|jgi:hypothetical protein